MVFFLASSLFLFYTFDSCLEVLGHTKKNLFPVDQPGDLKKAETLFFLRFGDFSFKKNHIIFLQI